MMNKCWGLAICLGVLCLDAYADQPIVLDNKALEGLASQPAEKNAAQMPVDQAQANEARKQQLLKSGKMSPRQRAELDKAAASDTNQQAGNAYLAANKLKPGVVTLPSGVQYKILKAGTGKKPAEESMIRCRYKGTLVDGSTFDQLEDKTPAPVKVAGLLPGLKEAVRLMPVGSKWEVVIPPELAYGAQRNRSVGPNSVLIYVIEILGIQ
jgi:FKBP-type peptidyl-prolyl cis-trans isomerase FklB